MSFENQKFFPEFQNSFSEILKGCRGAKVAVAGHLRPDGDCISSTLALAWALKNAGAEKVAAMNRDAVPFLYENFAVGMNLLKAEEFSDTSYKIITVDCADLKRVCESFPSRFPKPFACIDHHVSNNSFADVNIICPKCAATAELLAGMFFDCGLNPPEEILNALFMGIVMDTRSFTTNSTSAKTLEIAAQLARRGANPSYVATQLYQRERPQKLKLLAVYLNRLQFRFDGRLCYGTIRLSDFEKTGALKEDTDGLVDYARSMHGVDIAAVLEEISDGVKGSIRAKNPNLRVDLLAGKFGGGGHTSAAGFSLKGVSLEEFAPKFEEQAKIFLDTI